jgi:hypothetical protein
MFKKDPIFWWAFGIFAAAIALFAGTQNQFWLALMIASYLLRPTLASLGIAKRHVDERQLSIHYRSGNIGFAVTMIVCVIFAVKLGAEDNHDFELFAATICLGLAAKGLFNVILTKDFRQAASKIIIAVGLLAALFASLDAGSFIGIVMSALPGAAIAAIGLLARRFPRTIGIVIILLAIAAMIFILTLRKNWGQIVTAVIIGVPLIAAGVCLFKGYKNDKVEPETVA